MKEINIAYMLKLEGASMKQRDALKVIADTCAFLAEGMKNKKFKEGFLGIEKIARKAL